MKNIDVNSLTFIQSLKNLYFSLPDFKRGLPEILFKRFLIFLGISLSVYLFHTPILLGLMTCLLGISFGYLIALSAAVYGIKAYVLMIVLMMPQWIFYALAYHILIKAAESKWTYSNFRFGYRHDRHHAVIFYLGLLVGLVLVGCVLESYVNPLIIKKYLKIF